MTVSRVLPLASALVIVISSGLVHGRWSDQRAVEGALEEARVRLAHIPWTVGPWQGTETEIDRAGLGLFGIEGLIARRYENTRTGATVSVLLVCGRSGPIAVHGPEVCYAGAGYKQASPLTRRTVKQAETRHEFWTGDFRPPDLLTSRPLRITWGWTAKGPWAAPDHPRLDFSNDLILYKLYLIKELVPTDDPGQAGADDDFLEKLLPVLETSLFPHA